MRYVCLYIELTALGKIVDGELVHDFLFSIGVIKVASIYLLSSSQHGRQGFTIHIKKLAPCFIKQGF